MKKLIPYVLVAAASFMAISLQAQTADDIIGKHIEVIGGKDKIKQVNSVYMEGSMQVMGNESPTVVTILNGKGYKSESDFNGQKIIQCYTDKGGWTINPMAGGSAVPLNADQYKEVKDQIYIGGALYDYAAKGSKVELQGKEGNAYKIKLTSKDKVETVYFIDAATYYVSKIQRKGNMGGQEIDITITFADYKKTDFGYVVPFSMNTDLGQFQLAINFTKAEINKTVDPAIFEIPK